MPVRTREYEQFVGAAEALEEAISSFDKRYLDLRDIMKERTLGLNIIGEYLVQTRTKDGSRGEYLLFDGYYFSAGIGRGVGQRSADADVIIVEGMTARLFDDEKVFRSREAGLTIPVPLIIGDEVDGVLPANVVRRGYMANDLWRQKRGVRGGKAMPYYSGSLRHHLTGKVDVSVIELDMLDDFMPPRDLMRRGGRIPRLGEISEFTDSIVQGEIMEVLVTFERLLDARLEESEEIQIT